MYYMIHFSFTTFINNKSLHHDSTVPSVSQDIRFVIRSQKVTRSQGPDISHVHEESKGREESTLFYRSHPTSTHRGKRLHLNHKGGSVNPNIFWGRPIRDQFIEDDSRLEQFLSHETS